MLPIHKYRLYQAIRAHGLEPEERFEHAESVALRLFELRLRGSGLRFMLWHAEEDYYRFAYQYTRFFPDFPLTPRFPPERWIRRIRLRTGKFINFELVLTAFDRWVESEVLPWLNDHDVPDLWSAAVKESAFVSAAAEDENETFTEEELLRVRGYLGEVRTRITETVPLSVAQLHRIDLRLSYLEGAAKRVGRKDWLVIALSVFPEMLASLALDPAKAMELFRAAERLVARLFPDLPLLP